MNTHRKHNILVFDSGLGGLSIVEALGHHHIHANIFYLADKSHYPYGELSTKVLKERCLGLIRQGLQQGVQNEPIDLIIIACNTASTQVLPLLRQHFRQAIVGVVPAIKPAAALSQTKHMVLLATPGTVKTHYIDKLHQDFASHCQLHKVSSSELVHLAEQKLTQYKDVSQAVADALKGLLTHNAPYDTVILGCTHFPLLRDEIALALMPRKPSVQLLDSGAAIAKRVASLLPQEKADAISLELACAIYSASTPEQDQLMFNAFRHFGFAEVKTC